MNDIKELYQWACHGPWFERDLDTEYKYEVTKDKTLRIAFKGSSNFWESNKRIKVDWEKNFDIWVKAYKRTPSVWYAHRGFLSKWKAIEEEVLFLVYKYNPNKVLISGFSQGGAIAGFAHESIYFHFPKFRDNGLKTIVMGCPRFVWFWGKGGVSYRWNNFIRFECGWDVVTKLPPLLFGYSHVGTRKKIGRKWWQPSFRFKHNHLHYGDYLF